MAKTLGRNFKKRKALKNPLPFKSEVLHITSKDVARMGTEPGEIKLATGKYPFTPEKVTRPGKPTYLLVGVSKTIEGARKIATRSHKNGWPVARAKTKDGFVVYIR